MGAPGRERRFVCQGAASPQCFRVAWQEPRLDRRTGGTVPGPSHNLPCIVHMRRGLVLRHQVGLLPLARGRGLRRLVALLSARNSLPSERHLQPHLHLTAKPTTFVAIVKSVDGHHLVHIQVPVAYARGLGFPAVGCQKALPAWLITIERFALHHYPWVKQHWAQCQRRWQFAGVPPRAGAGRLCDPRAPGPALR